MWRRTAPGRRSAIRSSCARWPAYSAPRRQRPLLVGSVKTNIGHLEACAGVAGLIKVVLSLQHREIPPHLHFHDPTPHLPWSELPFVVPTEPRPWPADARAALPASAPSASAASTPMWCCRRRPRPIRRRGRASAKGTCEAARPLHLLALSGRSERCCGKRCIVSRSTCSSMGISSWATSAFPPASGDCTRVIGWRSSPPQWMKRATSSPPSSKDGRRSRLEYGCASTPPKVAFLFTGQGSQYPGMGRELYETQPTFRARCSAATRFSGRICAARCRSRGALWRAGLLRWTTRPLPSPLCSPLEYALAELWQSWGVRPAVVLGHSLGEYAAACVAGVFSLEDGLKLVAERARLMQERPRDGAMFAVFAEPAEVERMIRPYASERRIAAYNGPNNVVISGVRRRSR